MRVLITRLSSFGDIVHTWPLVECLRRSGPEAKIAWVVEEELQSLVAGHPCVARAIPVATRRWRRARLARVTHREVAAARREIAEFRAEVALDPQGLVKSACWAWMGRVPDRIGFAHTARRERLAGFFYTRTVAPPRELRHVVDLNLSLLTGLGIEPAYGALPDAAFLVPGDRRAAAGGYDVLVPGTARSGKQWGAAAFAALGRHLAAEGRRVLVAWGPGEQALAAAIASAAGRGVEPAPPTSIAQLAELLAGAGAVVGGDTGPVQLAAALGRPTVAIFLASDPERNAPRGPLVNVVTAAHGAARRGSARAQRGGEVTVGEVLQALAWLATERAG